MKICIVIANYYPEISNNLLEGATKVLKKNGISNYKKILAPGVFEVPSIISSLINFLYLCFGKVISESLFK